MTIDPFGIIAKVRAQRMPSVSLVSGSRQTAMSVWARKASNWSSPWKTGISASGFGVRVQAETGKPSYFRISAGAFAIMPKPRKPMRRSSGRTIGTRSPFVACLALLVERHLAVQAQHVHDDVFGHHRVAARRLDLAERHLAAACGWSMKPRPRPSG